MLSVWGVWGCRVVGLFCAFSSVPGAATTLADHLLYSCLTAHSLTIMSATSSMPVTSVSDVDVPSPIPAC